ncbi:ferredoxin [Streptomyces sp. Ru73]|uniref:ferredoxin n=1 Tax=Streptomyces sp. Ru73 TaxID=2080748 RepID=UPI000CDCFCA5|nr:ferredoxin [Streptomyces sp. Ru73]POX40221.1 ferredoxin [Streptomyces sp. Ru73]
MPTTQHISIDTDRCIGSGQCALTAPRTFTQDDDGFSALVPQPAGAPADPLAREAARACPVQAITVSED